MCIRIVTGFKDETKAIEKKYKNDPWKWSMVCEGCVEHVMNNLIESLIDRIYNNIYNSVKIGKPKVQQLEQDRW